MTVLLDAIIALTTVPLQRASLEAAHENAPAFIILALLAANIVLLIVVGFAIFVNGQLLRRLLPYKNGRTGKQYAATRKQA